METTIVNWGYIISPILGGFPKLGGPTTMEIQMEKNMENEMETGII